MAIGMKRVRDYVALLKRKDELQAQLREVNNKIGQLEPTIIDQMVNDGMQRLNAAGMTLYVNNRITVKLREGKSVDDAKAVLRELGLEDIIKPYTQSVTALAREWRDGDGEIPESFAQVYEISELPQLGHRTD